MIRQSSSRVLPLDGNEPASPSIQATREAVIALSSLNGSANTAVPPISIASGLQSAFSSVAGHQNGSAGPSPMVAPSTGGTSTAQPALYADIRISHSHLSIDTGLGGELGSNKEPLSPSLIPLSPMSPGGLISPSVRDGDQSVRRKRNMAGAMAAKGGSKMLLRASTRDGSFHGSKDAKFWNKVIIPNTHWYNVWLYVTYFTAVFSGIIDPFKMAFTECPGLCPDDDFYSVYEYLSLAIFLIDMGLRFRLAVQDDETGVLITDPKRIAMTYLKGLFALDLISTLPWVWVVLSSLGLETSDSRTALIVGLLHMLKLGRLYRLVALFHLLEYRMILSQLSLMLLRNNCLLFFSAHWFACIFYLLGRMEDYSPESWLGRNYKRFEDQNVAVKYVFSIYFSTGVFTGLGDSDFYAATPVECLIMIFYLFYNVVMVAYILGTITMLMVKSDKKAKQFRDRMQNLNEFSAVNDVPEILRNAMKEHLELVSRSEQASDEQVLSIYPSAIRRKVVRHLYLPAVKQCYLFRGCKAMFLDAFMAASRVELFMPKVHIITEGDIVQELFVIADGEVECTHGNMGPQTTTVGGSRTSQSGGGGDSMRDGGGSINFGLSGRGLSFAGSMAASMTGSMFGSMNGGSMKRAGRTFLGKSESFGEIAFFTDIPSPESVWSASVVRVLILSKAAYEALSETFPDQMRMVKENLQANAEAAMKFELSTALEAAQLSEEQLEVISQYTVGDLSPSDMPPEVMSDVKGALTEAQRQKMEHLDLVKAMVKAYAQKVDQMRIYEFLNSASAGNLEAVRDMIDSGLSVNCTDYDARSGLMLACHEGHKSIVRYLLDHGADPMAKDNFGNTAMFEAVRTGHDECCRLMLDHGATLGVDGIMMAAQMCTYVYEKDMENLRRMLVAGADPDAADYDQRCALHIAAAEGNLEAVRVMIEEGNAQVDFADRWDHTALDEAIRVGALDVVNYLGPLMKLAAKGQIRCVAKPKGATFAMIRARNPHLLAECDAVVVAAEKRAAAEAAAKKAEEEAAAAAVRSSKPNRKSIKFFTEDDASSRPSPSPQPPPMPKAVVKPDAEIEAMVNEVLAK